MHLVSGIKRGKETVGWAILFDCTVPYRGLTLLDGRVRLIACTTVCMEPVQDKWT